MIKKTLAFFICGIIVTSCSQNTIPFISEPSTTSGIVSSGFIIPPMTQTGISPSGGISSTGEELETEISFTGSNASGSTAIDDTLQDIDTILNK